MKIRNVQQVTNMVGRTNIGAARIETALSHVWKVTCEGFMDGGMIRRQGNASRNRLGIRNIK